MRAAALALGVLAVALAVCAAAVFGLHDGKTLVSPPEAVAEDFLRATSMRRYPQAGKHLSAGARAHINEDALAAARARLEEATGGIEDVRGEAGWIAGDTAEAFGALRGRDRDVRVPLRLLRERGAWRIAGISGLVGGATRHPPPEAAAPAP
jgi:hypothetical protein